MKQHDGEAVTVVVPAWNAAATLDAALASLAAQSRRPDAVIVVDDASTDETRAVVEPFTWVLPLTLIALDANEGPAGARDHGVRAARTPLIALLDADDSCLANHLETLLAARAASGAAIISPNARFWDPARGVADGSYRDVVAPPPFDQQRDDILRHDFVCGAALFERERYEQVGGFRAEFTGSEPWDLWIRMIDAGARVYGAEEATLLYRVAETSVSRSAAAFESGPALFDSVCRDLAGDPRRLAIAERTRRELRARLELYLAYEAAAAGDAAGARRHGRAASRGPIAVQARAAALVCAPTVARRWRDFTVKRRRSQAVSR